MLFKVICPGQVVWPKHFVAITWHSAIRRPVPEQPHSSTDHHGLFTDLHSSSLQIKRGKQQGSKYPQDGILDKSEHDVFCWKERSAKTAVMKNFLSRTIESETYCGACWAFLTKKKKKHLQLRICKQHIKEQRQYSSNCVGMWKSRTRCSNTYKLCISPFWEKSMLMERKLSSFFKDTIIGAG